MSGIEEVPAWREITTYLHLSGRAAKVNTLSCSICRQSYPTYRIEVNREKFVYEVFCRGCRLKTTYIIEEHR